MLILPIFPSQDVLMGYYIIFTSPMEKVNADTLGTPLETAFLVILWMFRRFSLSPSFST
jgi:hypothetical protein